MTPVINFQLKKFTFNLKLCLRFVKFTTCSLGNIYISPLLFVYCADGFLTH